MYVHIYTIFICIEAQGFVIDFYLVAYSVFYTHVYSDPGVHINPAFIMIKYNT